MMDILLADAGMFAEAYLDNVYSGTSHNGHSEKRTTSEKRRSTKERIETTVELIH